MSFALAQAAYAAVQLLGLFGAIAWQLRSRNRGWLPAAAVGDGWQLLPSRRSADAAGAGSGWVTPQWCSREVAAEGRAMSKQAVLKHLLTEGDKFILLVAGGDKQGENDAVYGLVFNLGARHTTPTFFMSSFPSPPASTPPQRPSFPFPSQVRWPAGCSSSRSRRSRGCSSPSSPPAAVPSPRPSTPPPPPPPRARTVGLGSMRRRRRRSSGTGRAGSTTCLRCGPGAALCSRPHRAARITPLALHRWPCIGLGRLRLVGLIGACFLCFGPGYSQLLLRLLYGQKWAATSAGVTLSVRLAAHPPIAPPHPPVATATVVLITPRGVCRHTAGTSS